MSKLHDTCCGGRCRWCDVWKVGRCEWRQSPPQKVQPLALWCRKCAATTYRRADGACEGCEVADE